MEHENIHLSVIVPVYNSAGFIAQTLFRLDDFLRGLACNAELILVNDGSRDDSLKIMNAWAAGATKYRVRVIPHSKNGGKGAAIRTGMLAAKGKYRAFLDADLAYAPDQILKLVEALETGADVAVASRVHPDSRYTISPAFFNYLFTRHLASRLINFFLRHTIIPHCNDSQAGLKGFRAHAAQEIFSRTKLTGFPFDVETLYLAERLKYRIREVAVDFRYFNEPTTVVFMQDGVSMVRDIIKIRLNGLLGRYKLPGPKEHKLLIINADDYGMNLAVSKGILAAAKSGMVRSTSVITNTGGFESSMDELSRSDVRMDVGLHLNLTHGRPLSAPKDVRGLIDKNGNFHSKEKLLIMAAAGKINEKEVYTELRAQCERLKKRWSQISHIDGHHHVHAFPVVKNAVIRLATEQRIKVVRSPCERAWSGSGRAFFRRLSVALMKGSRPSFWRSKGFLTPDHFGGFSLGSGPGMKRRWIGTLNRIPSGVTEIMVHPGYESDTKDTYNKQREAEIAVLNDADVLLTARRSKVELVSHVEAFRSAKNT